MAALNFADLAGPVSVGGPCGPDPEEDADLTNIIAHLEVMLPTSYFTSKTEGGLVAFDRSTIDFPAAFGDVTKLLKLSRDIRVLVLAGKLCLLNRDIPGFSACLDLVAAHLSQYWNEVHPRPDGGSLVLREVALQSLDDLATVVLPLQHAPLLNSKRIGALAFRSQLVAIGAVQPNEGEEHPEAGAIEATLKELAKHDAAELNTAFGHVVAIHEALGRIRTTWIERAGGVQALSFPRLSALIGQIVDFLEPFVGRRALAEASEPAGDSGVPAAATVPSVPLPPGSCTSVQEARAALAGCLAYFRRAEPSSPAVLLIGQAQRLIGKSLIEVIQIMFPEHVDKAILEIGTEPRFQLPLERLNASEGYGDDCGSGSGEYDSGQDEETAGSWDEAPREEGAAEEGRETEQGEGEGGDGEAEPAAEQETFIEAEPAAKSSMASVATRAEAVGRMKAVAAFYRQVEPSNPVPLLMDKACAMAQQDFISLLSDILPEVGIRRSSDE
ncbi:hypothetical protein DK26_06065 [Bosea sp. WAO]|uniref:type VI secretion system protein TssA n=1 Tax=Bosea sp. WAO TaxID=406341 RepID=UPI00074A2257|nr:type VI secretion system ImpA family N-terminal domain-containing protein [Bosea sp. WAO]KUL96388.1 hypothetical protein DK26_06065 [Bosea sp. WAO]